ncbi:C13 family peptidase [Acidovorax sp. RAC01]|uniref:C13 family peptidase n=1 Tax=Acidovorax sp. RAC01 TaxID=1842533 RepID=UPI00083E9428|nr:C13 family peptidase [Acidovorax sp. RAC01]AOG24357.1 peptidase C13 family protein [Acidovorax sp. RAC01]
MSSSLSLVGGIIPPMKDLTVPGSWADTLPSQWGPLSPEIEIPFPGAQGGPQGSGTPGATLSRADTVGRLPLLVWLREGLHATLFRMPRTGAASPTPWQLMVLSLLGAALLLAGARLEVPGPAQFDARAWLAPMWSTLVLLWCAWWAMRPSTASAADGGGEPATAAPRGGLAAWYALTIWAPMVPTLLLYGLLGASVRWPQIWAHPAADIAFWVAYALLTVWVIAVLIVVSGRFMRSRLHTAGFSLVLVGVVVVGMWQFPERPWAPAADALALDDAGAGATGVAAAPPVMALTQSVFEAQQALWREQLLALAPERPGVTDVYALVFAPYADENVFRRESTMVSELLEQRFDAAGRVMHLLNHAETAASHAWATPENLQRALAALAGRMDRESDVLVVYMTSHGARNHELAASHGPLQVAPVTPEMLRRWLDEAGIRNRVIAVSACYSGGWVEPLATDSTLVMTAADATHTSYGCGTRSELTFFGRAVFHEQLRQTHSFERAFAAAVPLIQQREVDAGKADGFSNPQIRVGERIRPVLAALETRLAGAGPDVAVGEGVDGARAGRVSNTGSALPAEANGANATAGANGTADAPGAATMAEGVAPVSTPPVALAGTPAKP